MPIQSYEGKMLGGRLNPLPPAPYRRRVKKPESIQLAQKYNISEVWSSFLCLNFNRKWEPILLYSNVLSDSTVDRIKEKFAFIPLFECGQKENGKTLLALQKSLNSKIYSWLIITRP